MPIAKSLTKASGYTALTPSMHRCQRSDSHES